MSQLFVQEGQTVCDKPHKIIIAQMTIYIIYQSWMLWYVLSLFVWSRHTQSTLYCLWWNYIFRARWERNAWILRNRCEMCTTAYNTSFNLRWWKILIDNNIMIHLCHIFDQFLVHLLFHIFTYISVMSGLEHSLNQYYVCFFVSVSSHSDHFRYTPWSKFFKHWLVDMTVCTNTPHMCINKLKLSYDSSVYLRRHYASAGWCGDLMVFLGEIYMWLVL